MNTAECLRSLRSDQCPACKGTKSPHHSLCKRCYFRLPPGHRNALYREIGSGYEPAMNSALEYLGASTTERDHARR